MKIAYNEGKTIARVKEEAERINAAKAHRNRIRFINLSTTLVVLSVCAACAVTHTALPVSTGLLFIGILLLNIVGTILADKSVPKPAEAATPAEVWHNVQTSGFTVVDVKSDTKDGKCSVSVVVDTDGKEETIDLGTYDIRESDAVQEETLDLDAECVYIPAAAVAAEGETA